MTHDYCGVSQPPLDRPPSVIRGGGLVVSEGLIEELQKQRETRQLRIDALSRERLGLQAALDTNEERRRQEERDLKELDGIILNLRRKRGA
jgi:hypothetical protein